MIGNHYMQDCQQMNPKKTSRRDQQSQADAVNEKKRERERETKIKTRKSCSNDGHFRKS